jgi:hypothetical protein
VALSLSVKNASPRPWLAEHRVRVGKRWLAASTLEVIEPEDDGTRVELPAALASHETAQVDLPLRTPLRAGAYVLEVDLVQDGVTWFRAHGSATLRVPFTVAGRAGAQVAPPPAMPRIEMHGVPVERVLELATQHGCVVRAVIDNDWAGSGWESHLYLVERRPRGLRDRLGLEAARPRSRRRGRAFAAGS